MPLRTERGGLAAFIKARGLRERVFYLNLIRISVIIRLVLFVTLRSKYRIGSKSFFSHRLPDEQGSSSDVHGTHFAVRTFAGPVGPARRCSVWVRDASGKKLT